VIAHHAPAFAEIIALKKFSLFFSIHIHLLITLCIWIWNFNNLQFPMLKEVTYIRVANCALLKQKYAENNGASALDDGDGKFSSAASEKIQSRGVWRW
jgi:hypothetical protein